MPSANISTVIHRTQYSHVQNIWVFFKLGNLLVFLNFLNKSEENFLRMWHFYYLVLFLLRRNKIFNCQIQLTKLFRQNKLNVLSLQTDKLFFFYFYNNFHRHDWFHAFFVLVYFFKCFIIPIKLTKRKKSRIFN